MFSIDPDEMMRALDEYDKEHKKIKKEVKSIQKMARIPSAAQINRNLEKFNRNFNRPATAKLNTV